MSDTAFTVLAFAFAVVLLACLVSAVIVIAAIVIGRRRENESGLGSDEEWARELLGYQAPHWSPSNGRMLRDDEDAYPKDATS